MQRLAPQTDTAHVVRDERAFTIVARWLYKLIQAQDARKVHLVTQRARRSAGLEVDAVLFLKAAQWCAFWGCAGPRSLSGGVLRFGWTAFFFLIVLAGFVLGQVFGVSVLLRLAAEAFLLLLLIDFD